MTVGLSMEPLTDDSNWEEGVRKQPLDSLQVPYSPEAGADAFELCSNGVKLPTLAASVCLPDGNICA